MKMQVRKTDKCNIASQACQVIAKQEITHLQNLPIAKQDISFKDGYSWINR
jgi:hypothetical protein